MQTRGVAIRFTNSGSASLNSSRSILMYTRHDPERSQAARAIILDIVDGRPWTASQIRQNNLRQHARQLGRAFRAPHPISDKLRRPCRRLVGCLLSRSRIFTALHPSEFAAVPALLRVAAYFHRWRRSPETWEPDTAASPQEQWRSILRHLFSKGYPMSPFLDSAWLAKGPLRHLERDLYCAIASGKSPRKVKSFPRSVSARALHLAMTAPSDMSVRRALRWGQVQAIGGCGALWKVVLLSRMATDFSNDAVWLPLMEKMVANRKFHTCDFGVIVDHLIEEIKTGGNHHAMRLLNQPLDILRKPALSTWRNIFYSLSRDGVVFRSPGVRHKRTRCLMISFLHGHWSLMTGIPRLEIVRHRQHVWEVHQLTSFLDLIIEGKRMKNCVATYRDECMKGGSAIFSFRYRHPDGHAEPCFTIEVWPSRRSVWQIRNQRNRWASRQYPPIREWMDYRNLR
jgi:hypothetical protein